MRDFTIETHSLAHEHRTAVALRVGGMLTPPPAQCLVYPGNEPPMASTCRAILAGLDRIDQFLLDGHTVGVAMTAHHGTPLHIASGSGSSEVDALLRARIHLLRLNGVTVSFSQPEVPAAGLAEKCEMAVMMGI